MATQPALAGDELLVVFDWDSVAALSEAAVAGAASIQFSQTTTAPTSISESEAFLRAYEDHRGKAWNKEETEVAWAAGLWVTAFNAKNGVNAALEHLASFGERRLRLASA